MSKEILEQKVADILGNLKGSREVIASGNEAKEAIKTKQKELITHLTELENLRNDEERSVIVLAEQLLQRGQLLDNELFEITVHIKSPELLQKWNEQNRTNVEHSEAGACLVFSPFRSEESKKIAQQIIAKIDDVRAERRNQSLHQVKELGQGLPLTTEPPTPLFAFPKKECKCPPAKVIVPKTEKTETVATETTTETAPKKPRGRQKKTTV